MNRLLLFEDKLGISTGYEGIWNSLLTTSNLLGVDVIRRSTYRAFPDAQLLVRQGNRKSPGFNPEPSVQHMLRVWTQAQINEVKPDVVVVWDSALFFLMNHNWNQATPDNMRGGVYQVFGVPFVCTLPIHAWNTKKSDKDIARLNDGFTDKEDWEQSRADSDDEDDSDSDVDASDTTAIWLEPVSVPYGKFVLRRDMEKVRRVMDKHKRERQIT